MGDEDSVDSAGFEVCTLSDSESETGCSFDRFEPQRS